jgi:tripartite-type tricarboxylate transporter receptor subunit TctC
MKTLLFIFAVAMAAFQGSAQAAGKYPDRPIRIIVPFTAAGPTDILARLLAEGFRETLGATAITENRPGAGGNLGTGLAAKADPDGYTLVIGYMGPLAINPWLYRNLSYKPLEDFTPISLLVTTPLVAIVNPSVPAHNMADLVKYAKSLPQGLSYASGGNGSANHMAGELFRLATGANLVHIPYKGIAPATNDVMAGRVPLMFDGLSVAIPQIKANRVRALAVTSRERAASLPQVPTMQEEGFRQFDVSAWFGLLAPAGLPAPILQRLEKATNEVMRMPKVVARVDALGMVARPGTSEEFRRLMAQELERWSKVVKSSGVKAD